MKYMYFTFPVLVFLGCLHSPQAIEEPATDIQGFINIFEACENKCPYFAHKGTDWKEIGAHYYLMAVQCETQDELLEVIAEMLAELNDPAIHLFKYDDLVYPYTREYETNYDMDVLIDHYLEQNGWAGWEEGYSNGFGWCDPSVLPYAFMDTIPGLIADSLDAFVAECIELDVPAVILDIRMNPVGAQRGEGLMGRFADKPYPGAIYRSRSGPEYDQYHDLRPAVYSAGPSQYTGTVILLVGENCRNMSENMTANFINFPNLVLVGDTTGGSVSALSGVKVNDYWYAKVPSTTILTYDKHWIEGAGIPPDFYIEATETDFAAGIDPVLDYAIEMLEEYR